MAAAAPAPAPAAAPVAPAPARKRGGIGCMGKLILYAVFLAVLAGAAVYYLPRQVEWATGWKLPAFVPTDPLFASAPAPALAVKPVAAPAPAADPAPAALAVATRPPSQPDVGDVGDASDAFVTEPDFSAPLDDLTAEVLRLQTALDAARAAANAADARQARAEQQIARLATQVADLQTRQGDINLRVELIALRLRLDGDTHAAAEQLAALANAAQDAVAARALQDESRRLAQLPPRHVLLALIDDLKAPAASAAPASTAGATDAAPDAPAPAAGGFADKLKTLFNVRYSPDGATGATSESATNAPDWQRLETLLLTGQDLAYWRHLQRLRGKTAQAGDPRRQDLLQRLHDYGAPDSRLRF